ncbi:glycyl-tRNA synthetase beta chain [Paraperlucidibaca baekdonensis]|uniref:Glycine--tRNA ligase beta subunit n=1 Tax=Paraperlucidibaca baekdonensis TaxID=748120 RepID=A0A3E0H8Y7_9GAMM|nr:glycine--tRNA ligase subunit beta [Paraperlucidibaca baekdonensis]REH40104.1 glycyl-tRNA synthetase beta chain [Paraperlucidibaca baekdonensis]
MSHPSVLFELGGEELPPKSLLTLATALRDGVEQGLLAAGLKFSGVQFYAAPRRLAIRIEALAPQQPDRDVRADGPPIKAAFSADGQATPAALGFARKHGVEVADLDRSGEKLRYVRTVPGEASVALLPGIFEQAIKQLPIAKRMRWGSSRIEFVRPMHWLVMLYGDAVVPATLLGLSSGRVSRGHRFHHPEPVELAHADNYLDAMKTAYVVADFDARREQIRHLVNDLAAQAGGRPLMPDALLNEVTALVEWPVPLVCRFEERFLSVPQEALISTMQDNQKYFCLVDANDQLMARFITVANIDSSDPEKIISGNEKVVRPRLTDAEFFFSQDKKITLAQRNERLKQIVFQAQLGTVYEKAQRVSALASHIAGLIDADEAAAELAGLLSKSDLASEMVSEFPELQGIAGYHYARHEGLADDVALALTEQYLPRFSGDNLPTTSTGTAVSLADKLDTLTGLFAIGQPPTGSKDPFALRRAALGILRMLIDGNYSIDLRTLVATAVAQHGAAVTQANASDEVFAFLLGRYRAMFEEQGISAEIIAAVQACQPSVAADVARRVHAVASFSQLPEAAALAAANKRVANILAKEPSMTGELDAALLQEPAEQALAAELSALHGRLAPLYAAGDYTAALGLLASLRAPVDAFFDQVMVNADDLAIRHNRLLLLSQLRALFLRVADISALS